MPHQHTAVQSPWSAPGRSYVHLSHEQVGHYDRYGYILLDGLFSPKEVRLLRTAVPEVLAERNERTVVEADGDAIRSVYGIHQTSPPFSDLARHVRLVEPARHLLDGDVYAYQSKLNVKAAFEGDTWPWHQDYIYWQAEDGMPEPNALTAVVFLDDCTELNGPLLVIPGSHHEGTLPFRSYDGQPSGYERDPTWIKNLVARLKYTIDRDVFLALARDNGVVPIKGRAGSVLFFHANLAHASPPNLSPHDRTLALFTYNRCDNAPPDGMLQRPAFLVARDTRPIVPDPHHVLRPVMAPER